MKAAIEENIQITNSLFDKIKELDKKVNNMESIKEKFNKNKAKIMIIIFECIIWAVREVGLFIVVNYGYGFYGDLIIKLTGIVQIGTTMVGAYIFGNKTELDDKVGYIRSLEANNAIKDWVIENGKLTVPAFKDPNK